MHSGTAFAPSYAVTLIFNRSIAAGTAISKDFAETSILSEQAMSYSANNPGFIVFIVVFLLGSVGDAQPPRGQHATSLKGATKSSRGSSDAATVSIAPAWTGDPKKHPLMPALRWAQEALPRIEQIESYTATMIKRERVNGKLQPRESLAIKVRQKPFSIYAKFLGPQSMKGQEALYVDGANDGKMLAHGVGLRALTGTVAIDPNGLVAMQGQLYPLTKIGILNLTKRLIEVAEADIKYGECTTKMIDNVKVNARPCSCIEVVHPKPRSNFGFHIARVFIDDKLNIPIRYECYGWPKSEGDNPPLMEEYTYLDVKLNARLADGDFDVQNPKYNFRPAEVASKADDQSR
jgi:hypothetical protein